MQQEPTNEDLAELKALKHVLGSARNKPILSSKKALTGHALYLASVMKAAFCNLRIKHGQQCRKQQQLFYQKSQKSPTQWVLMHMTYLNRMGIPILRQKVEHSCFVHTSSNNAALRLIDMESDLSKFFLIRRGVTTIPNMKKVS